MSVLRRMVASRGQWLTPRSRPKTARVFMFGLDWLRGGYHSGVFIVEWVVDVVDGQSEFELEFPPIFI